ncbi:MAG: electron transport complex subunit RsxA [Erysipelotrichaceae bacterium]|nr:electron transport complex subunit RsxA [Erysipelotrichaceae bacterium]
MTNLITMCISAVLINNIVLSQFLGICPFLGVSRKKESAIGMGLAVMFVMIGASTLSYLLYYYVLKPLNIEYMNLVSFILVIASFVQFTEMFVKKFSPSLYKSLGIYLPLITTNCAVLFVALANITSGYSFIEMLTYSFSVPLGFMLVLIIFSYIREKLDAAPIPNAFKGNPIALIVAALMAIAFSGLAGLV